MQAGADAAAEHRHHDAALAQFGLKLRRRQRAGGSDIDEVGFGLLHVETVDLAEAACKRAGIGVVVGEAFDMMVERMEAAGRGDAALPQRAAEPLLPAPIGAPSPLVKSIQTESHPAAISRAEMPVATQALSSRAPSICVASPCDFATLATSSSSALGQIVPPPMFAVCSEQSSVCGGA
jgi:hypothetical protein